jgi:membrane associated rhomboid family serine protease
MAIITLIIIVTTCLVSISSFSNRSSYEKLLFDAYLIQHKKQGYRFFTHAFVHADWLHLAFNMYALYGFGTAVEKEIYPIITNVKDLTEEWAVADPTEISPKSMLYYVLLYVGGIFFSSLWSFGKHKDNPYYRAVGASGAVSAVIMPYVLLAPWGQMQVFFVPMPAFVFGILYLVGSWYMGRRNVGNIGHDAHFWGAVFGILFTILLNRSVIFHFYTALMNGPR